MTTAFGNKIINALYEKYDDILSHLPKNVDFYFGFENPFEVIKKDCADLNNEQAFMLFVDILNRLSEANFREYDVIMEHLRPIITDLIPCMLVKLKLVKLNKINQEHKMTTKVWKVPTYSDNSAIVDKPASKQVVIATSPKEENIVDEAFDVVEKLAELPVKKSINEQLIKTPKKVAQKVKESTTPHSTPIFKGKTSTLEVSITLLEKAVEPVKPDESKKKWASIIKPVELESEVKKEPEQPFVEVKTRKIVKQVDTKQELKREVKRPMETKLTNVSCAIVNIDGKWVHETPISYIDIKGKERFIRPPANPSLRNKSTSLPWLLRNSCLEQKNDWFYHGLNQHGEPIGWYYVDEYTWKINATSTYLHVKNEDNTWSHYEEVLDKKGEIKIKPISVQWLSWFMTPGPFRTGAEPIKYV